MTFRLYPFQPVYQTPVNPHSPGDGDNFASFANIFDVFAKFFHVFASFSKFSDVFGPVWTCLDVFGYVRMHSDASGRVRMRSDAFGKFWKFSKKNVPKILVFASFERFLH